MAASFDLVVLGAGSGGYACAFGQLSWASPLHWSRRTRSVVPACIAVVSPPKRCCMLPRWRTRCAMASQFGVHAAIDKVDLAGVVSYADSVVARIYKGLSGLVQLREHHRC